MHSNTTYLIPKRARPLWNANLEPMDMRPEDCIDVPLLGVVTAGSPIEALTIPEHVAVPRSYVRRNSYALRVRGHSMIDDNIQDGDIVIVERRETAENGETVICMINGQEVTLKRFYVEPDGIRLQPANPGMEPIRLHHQDIEILGIVSAVIRRG